jgi:hypothetical protein
MPAQQEPGGADNQTRVEVQWPLDLFRKTGRTGVADREVDVSQHAVTDRERTLAADVRLPYRQVAVAIRTLTVTDPLLEPTERQSAGEERWSSSETNAHPATPGA